MTLRFFFHQAVVFTALVTACTSQADTPTRQRFLVDDGWRFLIGDPANAQAPSFEDKVWRTVDLPHDWSIEGKFDAKAPMGGGGGFLPAGIGWYRKSFNAPATWNGRRIEVEFEGVYMNADVWLNGQHLATHPYGYTSFVVDLTSALKPGAENALAVRVDNSKQKNSRWYSGSGIYRHVWLTTTGPVHVAPWGVFVSTPKVASDSASVKVQTRVANDSKQARVLSVRTELLSPKGAVIGKMESNCTVPAGESREVEQQIEIANPPLWAPKTPQLSRAVTRIFDNGKAVDVVTTPFGIRSLAWNAKDGLLLNGTSIKLNGGCIHGDHGVLGVASFDRAEERKIELLKAAGFNAVRTSHAPPSPSLLEACDRLGMLVMVDAFDCWTDGKNSFDYHVDFKDWWERDLDAMVLRDRNHPSVILWNIGNEVPNVFGPMGAEYSPKLVARIHALDSTRPVTNASFSWPSEDKMEFAEAGWKAQDIVGTNYEIGRHIRQHDRFPDRVLLSTESSPGNPADRWKDVTSNSYVIGDFVWSAQDYLGESGVGRWFYEGDPTEPVDPPKDENDKEVHPLGHGDDRLYPWHGALCGDLDLLGNRKPMSHLRAIVWDKGEKLFLAVRQPEDDKKIIVVGWGWNPVWESWTWPGREGKPMVVEVYSRYEKVRLYLNGKEIGEQDTSPDSKFRTEFRLDYQPGTLKAVGLQDGKEVEAIALSTVGEPAAIRLTPDRAKIHADGQDLSFIQVEVVDKNGNRQPNSDGEIEFALTGPGTIAGLGNADLKSEASYQGTRSRVFHGQAQVVIRSQKKPGRIELTVRSKGLSSKPIVIETDAVR